jgi:hypothetical protein
MALSANYQTLISKRVTPAQLTGSVTTLYTVPASTTTYVRSIILTNDTTSAVTATIHLVPTGGSADATNILINAKAIPTDGSPLVYNFGEDQVVLEAADTIQGLASTTTQVNYFISIDETTT